MRELKFSRGDAEGKVQTHLNYVPLQSTGFLISCFKAHKTKGIMSRSTNLQVLGSYDQEECLI